MRSSVCPLCLSVLLLVSTGDARRASAAARNESAGALAATGPRAKPSPAGASSSVVRRQPVYISNMAAPASLPGLGAELARTLRTALSDAGIDARLASVAGGTSPGRGDADSLLSGRVEEVGAGRLRLVLQWKGHTGQAIGEVEHLDDLTYAALESLRPRLLAEAGPGAATPVGATPAVPSPASPSTLASAALPSTPDTSKGNGAGSAAGGNGADLRKRPSSRPGVSPASTTQPAGSSSPVVVAVASSKEKTKPTESGPTQPGGPGPAVGPATSPTPTGPATPAVEPTGPVVTAPPPSERTIPRPRIAIHLVGEPLNPLPPAFLGAGAIAQQTMLAYVQNRLRYPAVGSRMTGLVGGLDALTQSLRVGARHTLMARFDTLIDGFGGFGTRTISGRLHIVLLLDGRPLLDRSLNIPPSTYYPTEPSAQVIARIVTAALDAISGELSARLSSPPPPAQ